MAYLNLGESFKHSSKSILTVILTGEACNLQKNIYYESFLCHELYKPELERSLFPLFCLS